MMLPSELTRNFLFMTKPNELQHYLWQLNLNESIICHSDFLFNFLRNKLYIPIEFKDPFLECELQSIKIIFSPKNINSEIIPFLNLCQKVFPLHFELILDLSTCPKAAEVNVGQKIKKIYTTLELINELKTTENWVQEGQIIEFDTFPGNVFHIYPGFGWHPQRELKNYAASLSTLIDHPLAILNKSRSIKMTGSSRAMEILTDTGIDAIFNFIPNAKILNFHHSFFKNTFLPNSESFSSEQTFDSAEHLINLLESSPSNHIAVFLRPSFIPLAHLKKLQKSVYQPQRMSSPLSTSKNTFLCQAIHHLDIKQLGTVTSFTPDTLSQALLQQNTGKFIEAPYLDSPIIVLMKEDFIQRRNSWSQLSKDLDFKKLILSDTLAIETQ